MFETMKLAAILAKGVQRGRYCGPRHAGVEDGDGGGRPHFPDAGAGNTGSGAPADMIALNLDEPNLCPIFNETSHAVYASSGKDCVFTMVEGRIFV